jgi:hypothetical protein
VTERFSCARAALERDEPQHATASTVRRWLLVEQAGPWGRDAVLESRLAPEVGAALLTAARRVRARVILLRRHGRDPAGPPSAFAAYTGPEGPWIERLAMSEPADLLDRDLTPLADGQPTGGEPITDPLYLVCTNGAHDVCCAEFGRPLAAAMSSARPEATWECSHIGGDRFAANLLVLPHGLYYGRVSAGRAANLADLYEEGRVDLELLRGRSCYPFHVQAVEHRLREVTGIDEVEGLSFVGTTSLEDGVAEVTFDAQDGRRFVAEVSVTPDPTGHRLTCRSDARANPPRYEVVGVATTGT